MAPKKLRLAEVPGYVYDKTGVEVSRQTVFNWTNNGYQGMKLKYVKGQSFSGGLIKIRITSTKWVDEFLAHYQRSQ